MKERKMSPVLLIGLAAIAVVFVLFIGFWVWASGQDTSSTGTFGDTFGVPNTLFSGLAFAGLIITILYQQKELALTRDEMAKSAKAQQELADSQVTTHKIDVAKMQIQVAAAMLDFWTSRQRQDSDRSSALARASMVGGAGKAIGEQITRWSGVLETANTRLYPGGDIHGLAEMSVADQAPHT